jgi:hypothetical protein
LLFSAFLRNDAAAAAGILYHAQGDGDGVWVAPPAVTPADTILQAEFFRRVPDSVVFLDGGDLPTATVTAKLLVQTTYLEAEMAGLDIREQGLFCGDATAAFDSGFMLDKIHHVALFKPAAAKLKRSIKLVLS